MRMKKMVVMVRISIMADREREMRSTRKKGGRGSG